jgi:hypothetical protein
MDTGTRLSHLGCPTVIPARPPLQRGYSYASILGALMYAMLGTRPDLAFAVSSLSRFSSNPGPSHWVALKRVLRYLHATADRKLTYGLSTSSARGSSGSSGSSGSKLPILGYCDADYAGSLDDRRSMSAYVFLIAGGAVSWQAQKQDLVTLSTVEAEYVAATPASKEAVWLRALLQGLGLQPAGATTILTDSQGSIALAKNPEHHQRSKHIDVRYHFVRELLANQTIEMVYVPSAQNVADQLTKPLSGPLHDRCLRGMGLQWE